MPSLYDQLFGKAIQLVESGIAPDVVARAGIRSLLRDRAKESTPATGEEYQERLQAFVEELRQMPVAIQQAAANEQHYEVPTQYFLTCLGPHLKYSSCLFASASTTLEEAEVAMLELCCNRAELEDGQAILELGCGWGSWALFNAARYPRSKVTAVSNSRTQKEFIDEQARQRGLKNLTVITADLAEFEPGWRGKFDRVVSVECFEHMKNYKILLERISKWLRPAGKLFVHIFQHNKGLPYHYEDQGETDWMTRYFFSGGTMPSADLLHFFQEDLALHKQWYVNGRHYSLTLEAWLKKQDTARKQLWPLFEETYGKEQAGVWWQRWRLFYMACSELFAAEQGERWGLGHYLFTRK